MPHGKRPPSTHPLHTFMDTLDSLRKRINHTGQKTDTDSAIEMYQGMIEISEWGRECQYAIKSLALFFHQDYDDIKALILDLAKQIGELEATDAIPLKKE